MTDWVFLFTLVSLFSLLCTGVCGFSVIILACCSSDRLEILDLGTLLKLFAGIANFVETGLSSFCFFTGVLLFTGSDYYCKNKGSGISLDNLFLEALFPAPDFLLVAGRCLGLRVCVSAVSFGVLPVLTLGLFDSTAVFSDFLDLIVWVGLNTDKALPEGLKIFFFATFCGDLVPGLFFFADPGT